ncbi:MAG: aminotransferase class III-fold pyridoxal phosphate-dependent enzyme [Tannerellaceae bacterium]|jgi:acetylornithine aminotransferase|nr:aminotransferase class III-fold pyridoxal phosphate-dependent enzyme [Tannerellaceae bacterium]
MKLFDVYSLLPVEIVKGLGAKVWDAKGVEYLDYYTGHAVVSIGHSHPYYVSTLKAQLEKLGFYSNSVVNRLQSRLAERVGEVSGYEDYTLFMINSGAEANENALKLASFVNGKRRVIAFKGSFHGRTSAAVAVTDNRSIVAPVNEGLEVVFVPFNEAAAVEAELKKGGVTAIIVEAIQGVGGIRIATDEFLVSLEELATRYDACLIMDEVQAGWGRSGRFFAHEWAGIKPDIITVGKGMGNGFPVAGVLISGGIAARKGMLGTTFGGNHLACAAALAVLDVIEAEELIANAEEIGGYLMGEIRKMGVKEVRGKGLMIGIDLEGGVKEVRRRLLEEQRVLTGVSGEDTIRLLPPLSLRREEAEEFIERFRAVL